VVEKALSRERDERYQTAAEFQEALERALPPAPARDVSRAVETHAGAMLEERRGRLRTNLDEGGERVVSGAVAGEQNVAMAEPSRHAQVDDARGGSAPRLSAFGKALRVLVACLLVAGVATGAVLVERSRGRAASPQSQPTAEPVASSATAAAIGSVQASPVVRDPPLSLGAAIPAPSPTQAPQKPSRASPSRELHRRNPYGSP
jgi:hypothetical protein